MALKAHLQCQLLGTFSLTLFQPGLPRGLTTVIPVGWLQTPGTKGKS